MRERGIQMCVIIMVPPNRLLSLCTFVKQDANLSQWKSGHIIITHQFTSYCIFIISIFSSLWTIVEANSCFLARALFSSWSSLPSWACRRACLVRLGLFASDGCPLWLGLSLPSGPSDCRKKAKMSLCLNCRTGVVPSRDFVCLIESINLLFLP